MNVARPIERLQPSLQVAGFTLIEVLVAALVLGIGFLGLAGLQMMSLRHNQSAHLRSVATQAAYDMVDRMRANRVGLTLESGSYGAVESDPESAPDCAAVLCGSAQMVLYDVTRWSARLAADLPLGAGTVCRDSTPEDGTPDQPGCDGQGDAYAIKIWWDDDRSGAVDPPFVTSYQP